MAERRTPRKTPEREPHATPSTTPGTRERAPRRTPAATGGTATRHWTDWVNVIAGVWLVISPWVIATGLQENGAWNTVILGLVIAVVALFGFADTRSEWVNVAAAVWLFFSPWLLGFVSESPNLAWNCWIVSVIVFLVALAGATHMGGRFATTRA
ncbi:MAG: SPW repeat protein [Acidobacteriota bacterium]